jgi:hypothetical protein
MNDQNQQLLKIFKLQATINKLIMSYKMDPHRYANVLELVLEKGDIQIVKKNRFKQDTPEIPEPEKAEESAPAPTFIESKEPSVDKNVASSSTQEKPSTEFSKSRRGSDLRSNSQIALLTELGIKFFSIEDTERGFGIKFTHEEKLALHSARNHIADKLVRSMLVNGLSLRYYTEKKAYVIVYPKGVTLNALIKRFPKLLDREKIHKEIPSILEEDFANEPLQFGIGVHFGLGSFPGMKYEEQQDHLDLYRDETDIPFKAAKAVEEVCAIVMHMTKIKNYPDSYGCFFRTSDRVDDDLDYSYSGQIAVSAKMDHTISVDICMDEPGYRGISAQHGYYL